MSNRIIIAVIIALALFSCTQNVKVAGLQPVEEFHGKATKVAFLPLKAADSVSRNVVKIMNVRDIDLVFSSHPKYQLIDMDEVARIFKDSGYTNVDAFEKEQYQQMAKNTGADVVIIGSVTSTRQNLFSVNSRFYSIRSDELKQHSFNVVNYRDQRLEMLEKDFMPHLDDFVSNEMNKLLNFAMQNYHTQKYQDAEAGFLVVLGLDPENYEANYYLGQNYAKMEKYDKAEQSFLTALELKPEEQNPVIALIEIYEKTNQPIKRLQLMEGLAEKREDEELWLAVANLYDEAGNPAKAKEALGKSLKINPDYTHAIIRLGFMLYEENDFLGAIPSLEKAAEMFPDNQLVSDRLGVAYFKANRLPEAIVRYENMVKNDPENVQAYLTVAGLYRTQAGELSDKKQIDELNGKAIKALNEVKKRDPDNAMAYLNLAAIYLSQKKNADAESNANTALAKNPSLYQPYVILASVTQSKGHDQYTRFADLEKQAAKAVGKKADQLKKDRDAAKNAALGHFRKAIEQLEAARSRATDASAIKDINSRISSLNSTISQIY